MNGIKLIATQSPEFVIPTESLSPGEVRESLLWCGRGIQYAAIGSVIFSMLRDTVSEGSVAKNVMNGVSALSVVSAVGMGSLYTLRVIQHSNNRLGFNNLDVGDDEPQSAEYSGSAFGTWF